MAKKKELETPKTLADLNPNPENPRKITDAKLEQLKKSLLAFGDLSGIVFNHVTQRLAGGHQRKIVLPEDAKIEITHRYEKPTKQGTIEQGRVEIEGEWFSYRGVVWDENTEKAANIAANSGAGQWDWPKLTEMFNSLDAANFDLDLTMWDSSERDRIMGGWDSDMEKMDGIEESDEAAPGVIKITCPEIIKDEVLIYLKAKLLETSFEGVHIE